MWVSKRAYCTSPQRDRQSFPAAERHGKNLEGRGRFTYGTLRWSKTGGTATTVSQAAHLPVDPKEHRPLTISS